MSDKKYCLISPCRNEEAYIRSTLDTVLAQTVLPDLWVIVDDGSTDATPRILEEYGEKCDFIRVVKVEDRGERSVGPGVVASFYRGLETVDLERFKFICKLDVDLELPPRYFETLIERMEENPRIGTLSGKPYERAADGQLVPEKRSDEMSVGMTKFYRVDCFNDIGGLVREVMWDGIDCHRSRMLGWIARSIDEPDLRFVHLRTMGSSQQSLLTGKLRHGFGQYFMGTGPVYMLASALYRMSEKPYVIGGLAMFWGYLRSFLRGARRYDDLEFRKFLRQYQWRCLTQGKTAATEAVEEHRAAVWRSKFDATLDSEVSTSS